MNMLAIELSTYKGSLAILSDGKVLTEQEWDAKSTVRQNLFLAIMELLRYVKITPAQVDIIAVGLGPGSFSGIRIALATAFGFTLPDHKPVFGISSGAVIAADVMSELKAKTVAVIGDARRNQLWLARFSASQQYNAIYIPEAELEYCLVNPDMLSSMVKNDDIVVTPEIERIGKLIKEKLPQHHNLLNTARLPSASVLAKLVYAKIKIGLPSEPLKPLYMHPPVVAR